MRPSIPEPTLTADGSVDASFDPGMEGDGLHTLVVQPDGRILVGGFFTMLGGQARTNLGRLNPDGTLDSAFHPEMNSAVNVFAVEPDGNILVGGSFAMLDGTNRNHLGRLYPDGSLDKTLDVGGGPSSLFRMQCHPTNAELRERSGQGGLGPVTPRAAGVVRWGKVLREIVRGRCTGQRQ